jgi:hypothetical protein
MIPSGIINFQTRCKNSEIGAADKKMEEKSPRSRHGGAHDVTMGDIPSLEQF